MQTAYYPHRDLRCATLCAADCAVDFFVWSVNGLVLFFYNLVHLIKEEENYHLKKE